MSRVISDDQADTIRVLSWNINGLANKMADPDLIAFINDYDIIFLIETMKSNDFEMIIPGYKFHHVSRKFKHKNASRASGGIGILVSSKYDKLTRINSTYDHLVWLTLTTNCCQKNTKIGCAYIPPENSTYVGLRNDYFTMLEEEVARYTESHHILLCGDFNSRTGHAPDYENRVIDNNTNLLDQRYNEDVVINKYGRFLLNFCINTGLKIANGRMFDDNDIGHYTYYSPNGASTIDYLILREDYMISKFKVLPKLVESDHCPLQFHIPITRRNNCNTVEMEISVNDSSSSTNVYIWQDEKKEEYQMALRNEQTSIAFEKMLCTAAEGCDTDNLCDMFEGILVNAISPLFQTRQPNGKNKKTIKNNFPSNPWYDRECKSLKSVINNIAKHRNFNERQVEYNILLRQYKQLIQRKKRQYQHTKLNQLENMRTEDPNAYWKFWKSLNPRASFTGPSLMEFVQYFEQQVYPPHVDYFDHGHMNNILNQVTSSQTNLAHYDDQNKSDLLQFLNSPITLDEIIKAMKKLKCKKAAGVDGISAEFLKHGCNELLPALVLLFNTIITNGEYPSKWATGIIHPVHKKGDHSVPDNYRKITVMPCIGKLFESILNNRLTFKNEVCDDSDPYQAGFKSNSRTTDNIFILCAIIEKQKCLSKPLYTCFVDFTKAFDYIDRTALYYKLLKRGIHGKFLNVIQSMFSKSECRVKWDSCISGILKSEYGVLQGGMLSPKLFTEFLQDISKAFDQDNGIPVDTLLMVYLLFADDLVLFSDSAEGLQKQLTALYIYASLWHILVSIPKTKVLIFHARYSPPCGNFYYGDNIIEKAEQYKYLGVVYSTKCSNNVLKETFPHLASQAGKAIFSLYKQSRPVVGKLSPSIAFKVFDCQILPILEYGSDIWYTGKDVYDLEKIHLKFLKSTLGVRKQTPTPAIYGDTGRFPLIIRQHFKAVKYWCRILNLSLNHPVRNAYNMLLELDGNGFKNWCSRIRSVLEITGLGHTWETQHIENTNKFMLTFKESIVSIFTQQWRQDIDSSSKLRSYALIKKQFCVEPYILNINGNHLITALARYRMSSHDLKIERGRYNIPITPIHQRLCTRCELHEIDDEIHLLLHCNAMDNEREIFFNSTNTINTFQPTHDIFLQIMTSRDGTVVRSLAKFIYACFKKIV